MPRPAMASSQPFSRSGVAATHLASSEAGNSLKTPPAFSILAMEEAVPVSSQSRYSCWLFRAWSAKISWTSAGSLSQLPLPMTIRCPAIVMAVPQLYLPGS